MNGLTNGSSAPLGRTHIDPTTPIEGTVGAPTIVLTGATSGIGLAAARRLAAQAGTLIHHGPEPESAVRPILDSLLESVNDATDNEELQLLYFSANYKDPTSLLQLAKRIRDSAPTVDVLINNAGIPGPNVRQLGPWDCERAFGINYLAGTLLTELLLPSMATDGRIINVASATQESAALNLNDLAFTTHTYSPVAAYAQSKLAIVTHSARLARSVPQCVFSVHPGVISTGLLHAMFGVGGQTPERGGSNLVAAVSTAAPSGSYLYERDPGTANPVALDPAVQASLQRTTERLLGMTIH